MNYLKIYINLIRNSLNRIVPNTYIEKHHVFPKSIFGTKNNNFVVKLTAREHYIAHGLLEKIYIKRYGKDDLKTKKMICAFFMMNNFEGKGQYRYVNSTLYENNKIKFIESISGHNNKLYGKKRVLSEQHLRNMKLAIKYGKDNPLYGIPRSEEIKQKMRKPKIPNHGKAVSEARKGIKFTEEHKLNLSISHKGIIPGNKGKTKYTLMITNPSGVTETTNDLTSYCEKNGIPNQEMSLVRVAKGIRKQHKNFIATIVSIDSIKENKNAVE
jgi:hypothetical protein